jgi:hypothetical protein
VVAVSVSGAVILTSVVVWLFLLYRRKKRRNNGEDSMGGDGDGEKPVAVRGSPATGTRFNPWSGGTYPMDKLKLPLFTPWSAKKRGSLNFGFATSDYSDVKETVVAKMAKPVERDKDEEAGFRLQKPPKIKSAETVRLIRVNSEKNREPTAGPTAQNRRPVGNPSPPPRKPIPELPKANSQSQYQPPPQPEPQPQRILQPIPQRIPNNPLLSQQPQNTNDNQRYSVASELSEKLGASGAYSAASPTQTSVPSDSTRDIPGPVASREEQPGWRPPTRNAGISRSNTMTTSRSNTMTSTATTQVQRPKYRDSMDPDPYMEAAYSSTDLKLHLHNALPRASFNMTRVSDMVRSEDRDSGEMSSSAQKPAMPVASRVMQPKKQGPRFATFPTVRSSPPSMMHRPRPPPGVTKVMIGSREE